jgi:hypothetical protein
MGYRARPVSRKHVPRPTTLICLIAARATHDGNVFVTVSGTNKGLSKPQDVDGVELEYYDEDPRHNPAAKATTLGRFAKVKTKIKITFPLEDYDRHVYIRGRWYNNSGVSEFSPIVDALIERA